MKTYPLMGKPAHTVGRLVWAGLLGVTMVTSLPAGTVFSVTSTSDSGAGTLRDAIGQANATPNGGSNDRIEFAILPAGAKTIVPLTPLPFITDPVDIDGRTQTGFTNTPLIELNGTSAGSDTSGLVLTTSNCTIRGLAINRFRDIGLKIEAGGGHVFQGNFIGTDVTGMSARGNINAGVLVYRSGNNQIGGTNIADRNLISGNAGTGLYLLDPAARSNRVEGNFIGTRWDGAAALPNGTNGIVIYNAPNNFIGGAAPGARNLISGNQRSGIYVFDLFGDSIGNVIAGNYIGTDITGAVAMPNTIDGATLVNAQIITIGGTNPGAGNLISGNGERGINMAGSSRRNIVQGNRIGTDATGRLALGNLSSGVGIDKGASNLIGGPVVAARNVIAGNRQSGVHLLSLAAGNRVQGNFIGVDQTGTNRLGNTFNGVTLTNAPQNEIGGNIAGARNVIAGNSNYGVYVIGTSTSNVVAGNLIGTDVTGTKALRNGLSGVRIESSANRVGGSTPEERNVISGNTDNGVWLLNGANGNRVQGNYIGTDITGALALPNGRAGIGVSSAFSSAFSNVIGGSWATEGNVISGNGDAGIYLIGATVAANVIQGNRIGTDVAGAVALGNSFEGIYLDLACSNQLGGATSDLGNVVAANIGRGIRLTNACWNVMQNNRLGTALDGVADLGNGIHTVELENGSSHNTIGGGPGLGNIIAYTKGVYAGVRVRTFCTNNLILNNSIFANARLGIDLEPTAFNPNDLCDTDAGSNSKQNFPTLSAVYSGNGTLIRGSLNSRPNLVYRVQFFSNLTPDSYTGIYGEGQTYLGETFVTTTGSCIGDIEVVLPGTLPAGHWVTATATDPDNNTSEFAACVRVTRVELTIASTGGPGSNLLTVSWPGATPLFHLQQTDHLLPPIQWLPATDAPVVIANGTNTVTLGATNGTRFYRVSLLPLP